MTPQEREMIEGLFQRLKATDVPEKDKEAEQLIQARMAALPSAAYQLVQTVLVQEHALTGAQARIEQLEKELANRAAAQPAGGGTSFLGGLMGRNRWNSQGAPEPAAQPAPRSSVPITAPAAPAAAFGGGGFGGGSFLGTALTTAAGVAGGALLYDGLRSLLFHNPSPFGQYAGGYGGLGGGNVYETVNNYYGDDARRDDRAIDTSEPGTDLSDGLQNADYDPSDDNSDIDPGGDFGGSEDV